MTDRVFETWESLHQYTQHSGISWFNLYVDCGLHDVKMTHRDDKFEYIFVSERGGLHNVNMIRMNVQDMIKFIKQYGSFHETTYGFDCKFKDTLFEMTFMEILKPLWDERTVIGKL